jgi:long-chain acyl-CoA synthetase
MMDSLLALLQRHEPTRSAIVAADSQRCLNYDDLIDQVKVTAEAIGRTVPRGFGLLYASNTIDAIVLYLACLELGYPICLLEPTPENLQKQIEIYQPAFVLLPGAVELGGNASDYQTAPDLPDNSYQLHYQTQTSVTVHPDLALLLQTSGSTGSPKLVRLSRKNVLANAQSIAEYLQLTPAEVSIQSLPMQYSYGLSLINSHLVAGGTIVLTSHSFMRPEFWQDFDTYRCTSFAGVPYMYETLARLSFTPADHPTLRTLTQAGGALNAKLVQHYAQLAAANDCRLVVMYGQTEATARIAYVPPDRLLEKLGSIGQAIPQGQLTLRPLEPGSDLNELVYHGPNVMLGYAETAADLAKGDELNGELITGDIARVDAAGFFYIMGRIKRIAKLFGQRVNLQDIEVELEKTFPYRIGAIDVKDKLGLLVEDPAQGEVDLKACKSHIATYLRVPPVAIVIQQIDQLPLTASGKKDYSALKQLMM